MRSLVAFLLLTSSLAGLAVDARADVGTDHPRIATPEVKQRANRILLVGSLTFGLTYMPMLALGFASTVDNIAHFQIFCGDTLNSTPCTKSDAASLIYPFAGPMIYASPNARDHLLGTPSPAERALLITDGVLQITGVVTMLAAGVYYMAATDPPPRLPASDRGLSLEPSVGAGRFGVDAVAHF